MVAEPDTSDDRECVLRLINVEFIDAISGVNTCPVPPGGGSRIDMRAYEYYRGWNISSGRLPARRSYGFPSVVEDYPECNIPSNLQRVADITHAPFGYVEFYLERN